MEEVTRPSDDIYRFGGEEFAILLPSTEGEEAAVCAEKIRETVAATKLIDGRQVAESFGVSELREGETAAVWLKRCDDALYCSKEEGRNRVSIG